MNIEEHFRMAAIAAVSKKDWRGFLIGSVAIRNDGALVASCNGPAILYCENKKRSFPEAHAEIRLSKKIDVGSTVFVVRVRKCDGQYGHAKPCKECRTVLKAKGVKRVYFTIGPTRYGVWKPGDDWIRIGKIRKPRIFK